MLDGTIRCSEKGVVMSSMPALRLRGRGDRVRLRKIGRWDRDPLVEVKVACRTSVAVEKMLAESLRGARDAGCSWSSIASALGVAPTLSSWDQIAAALAFNRRVVWNRVVGER